MGPPATCILGYGLELNLAIMMMMRKMDMEVDVEWDLGLVTWHLRFGLGSCYWDLEKG